MLFDQLRVDDTSIERNINYNGQYTCIEQTSATK